MMVYEEEFRRKVLSIKKKRNLTIEDTAELFALSKSTIQRWLKRLVCFKPTGKKPRMVGLYQIYVENMR